MVVELGLEVRWSCARLSAIEARRARAGSPHEPSSVTIPSTTDLNLLLLAFLSDNVKHNNNLIILDMIALQVAKNVSTIDRPVCVCLDVKE